MHNSARGALVQAVQHLHVVRAQLEAEDVAVEADPIGVVALGQTRPALLQAPPDEDLVRRDAMSRGDGPEGRVVGLFIPDDGAVGLHDYLVVPAVPDYLALLVPRVQLGAGGQR
jgi:hypothetical protein